MRDSTLFLFFWRGWATPQIPKKLQGAKVVPLHYVFLTASYPKLGKKVAKIAPEMAESANRLQGAFSALIQSQMRHYLVCRVWILFAFFCVLAYGIFFGRVVNPGFLIWMLIFLIVWAIICRLVMNGMTYSLMSYELMDQERLDNIVASTQTRGVKIVLGRCAHWLEVSVLQGSENVIQETSPLKVATVTPDFQIAAKQSEE